MLNIKVHTFIDSDPNLVFAVLCTTTVDLVELTNLVGQKLNFWGILDVFLHFQKLNSRGGMHWKCLKLKSVITELCLWLLKATTSQVMTTLWGTLSSRDALVNVSAEGFKQVQIK